MAMLQVKAPRKRMGSKYKPSRLEAKEYYKESKQEKKTILNSLFTNVLAGLNIFAVKKSWNKIDKQAKLFEPKQCQRRS